MPGPEPEAPAQAAQPEPVPSGEQQEGHGGAGGAAPAGDAEPQPLGVGTTPTGQAAVDSTLRRLADADHLPASGHLRVYEDVHRGLRDVLAGLDQHPGPPAPSPTTHDTSHDNRS
ncbi:hypothetical protein SAMN05428945_3833 [Streptomyces sp. 2224.1]|nr:hypothetical protein BX261_1506 [Streptomyces sp. 2321.6]SDR53914.1 hypothetical protein SAMN05216511_5712 [Streptomyces sp. KS_16]SEC23514.1 hypothetical protein SAMN05428940_1506 [Streptomyces sp. 2133.1]SED09955.1 hypothetical protein SAMN05428945_3833 [Streptomyces sp. 2224.1]SEF06369.1 hypothetical protein SAMN05428954_5776 [Streptomyces sp. 2112.3]SNC66024.1 hypothetical protein SAMN06272741_1502 [Streptomyces sp. 2114.4]